MKGKKRLAVLLAAWMCLSLLAGCGETEAGLSLTVCAGGAPESLDPIYATESADQTILVHLYENLMRVATDVSGKATVTNGMAKSVDEEENQDGTVTYTFKLRSAKWSDGRAVKAGDFVYAWQRLVDPANASPYASILSVVVGYDEVRETGDVTALQVTAKNDTTLVVVLDGYYDWFLTDVCTSPATLPLRQDILQKWEAANAPAQEAGEAEGEAAQQEETPQPGPWWMDVEQLVTNGPYQPASYTLDSLTVTASEKYTGSLTGPRELVFRFADTAEEAWALYEEKEVDFVWSLTDAQMEELAAENETWTPAPELATYTVLFNCNQEVFADQLVREAMVLALDRAALAQAAGVTARPAEGLVPPGASQQEEGDFRTRSGALLDNDPELYEERCAQAQELLSQAGYERGEELGVLEYLYIDEGGNSTVAHELVDQWSRVLGMDVVPRSVTVEEMATALESGSYTLAGVNVTAVTSDAECFLTPWTSGSVSNVVGYENSAYDTLIAIIAAASDGTARLGCLHDAEELLLADAPLAPLYTTVTDWELRDTLTGVVRDARGWFSFAGVTVWNG